MSFAKHQEEETANVAGVSYDRHDQVDQLTSPREDDPSDEGGSGRQPMDVEMGWMGNRRDGGAASYTEIALRDGNE